MARHIRVETLADGEHVINYTDPSGQIASGTVGAPTSPGSRTVTVSANRTTATAPASFIFEADTTGFNVDRPYYDLGHVWSYGDPGSTFSRMVNYEMPWENNANIAYTPNGSHTFTPTEADFDGAAYLEYTVTCTARDRDGNTASGQITVRVDNPASIYPGPKTLVVSQASDFTGAPSGAVQYTSIHDAFTAAQRNADVRVLLRRGETYDTTSPLKQLKADGFKITIGAFGTGDPPLLTPDGIYDSTRAGYEIILDGIEMQGNYDPTASSLPNQGSGSGYKGDYPKGDDPLPQKFLTINDCKIAGFGANIAIADLYPDAVINNSEILDGYNYLISFQESVRSAFTGVAVEMPDGTRNGPIRDQAFEGNEYPNHFTRQSRVHGTTVYDYCRMICRHSWFNENLVAADGGLTGPSGNKKYPVQPPIRWNTGGGRDPNPPYNGLEHAGSPHSRLSWTRTVSMGGALGLGRTNDTIDPQPCRAIFDMWVHMLFGMTNPTLFCNQGGATFRNGITLKPDIDQHLGEQIALSSGSGDDPNVFDYDNEEYPVEFYNITFVDLKTGGNVRDPFQLVRQGDPYDVQRIENNVIHAPGYGLDADAPLDTSTMLTDGDLITVSGYYWLTDPVMTEYAVPAETYATYRPQPGSAAIENADNTQKVSVYDFWGNVRPANAARGAMEPE